MSCRAVSGKAEIFALRPGDVVCAERGDTLETLLGSCVAVILTDRRRTVGAMCHIVHHGGGSDGSSSTFSVNGALQRMYELITDCGLSPWLCDAFVYGGGNMFPDVFGDDHVGEGNACAVLQCLEDDCINVAVEDLGGTAYRRLQWTIGSGVPHVVATSIEKIP